MQKSFIINCQYCKKMTESRSPSLKHCSPECHISDNLGPIPEDPNACWNWVGALNNGGYGASNHKGFKRAHNRVYSFLFGPIAKGLLVRHKCTSKACCNPRHLELGTKADNNRDKIRDGTTNKGKPTKSAGYKLSKDIVLKIFYSTESTRKTADQYEVPMSTVLSIRNQTHYKRFTHKLSRES